MSISCEIKGKVLEITLSGDFVATDADEGHKHMQELIKDGSKLRLLVNASDAGSFTREGMLEDLKVNMVHSKDIEKMAFVDKEGKHDTIKRMLGMAKYISSIEAKVFLDTELEVARTWIESD